MERSAVSLFLPLALLLGQPASHPSSIVPPAELVDKYEALQVSRRKSVVRLPAPPVKSSLLDRSFEARLEEVEDGWVRLSRSITRAQRKLLIRRGIPVRGGQDRLHENAIRDDGRYHQVLRVGGQLADEAGLLVLTELVGMPVTVLFARSPVDGHVELAEIRRLD